MNMELTTKCPLKCPFCYCCLNTGKELPIDEGVLSEVDMIGNEFGISYAYSGLKDQSSFKDVIDKLGAPNSQVKISSDDTGVSIELSYFNSTQDGDKTSDKSLTVYFGYDTTNNTASVRQINLAITQSRFITDTA